MRRRRRHRSKQRVSDGEFFLILGMLGVMSLLYTFGVSGLNIQQLLLKMVLLGAVITVLYFFAKLVPRLYYTYRETMRHRRGLASLEAHHLPLLLQIHPTDFEHLVCEFFSLKGFTVEHTGRTNDGGIDGRMWKDGKRYAIQVKRYRGNVPAKDVRDFYGSYVTKYAGGFFVTTSDFSENARQWIKKETNRTTQLITGYEFITSIPKENLARYARET